MSAPTPELLKDLAERWKNGERLPQLARDASEAVGRTLACASVRGWIIKTVGGAAAFKAASAARDEAHPRPSFGGGGRGAMPLPDDTQAQVLATAASRKGWTVDIVPAKGYRVEVFVSPTGERYVRAQAYEVAAVVADLSKKGLGNVRLRLEHGSRQHRAQKRDAKLAEHGVVQHSLRRSKRRKAS